MGNLKDKIERSFGLDRLCHFGIGGLVCAVVSIVFNLREAPLTGVDLVAGTVLGVAAAAIASAIGECFDDKFDGVDVLAGVLGALCVTAAYAIGVAIN